MKTSIPGILKSLILSVIVFTTFAAAASVAKADEVLITGHSNGCFSTLANPCQAPNSSAPQTTSLLGLTFTNSTFSGITANGFLAFGGNPVPIGTQGTENFGTLFLDSALPATYDGSGEFRLRLTFTSPQGITDPSRTFVADIFGTVRSDASGGVTIDFSPLINNQGVLFTFNDLNCEPNPFPGQAPPGQQVTCGQGTFLVRLNDVSINPGQLASITGDIRSQQTPIPEPATLLLLGSGLSGFAAYRRSRRKAKVSE